MQFYSKRSHNVNNDTRTVQSHNTYMGSLILKYLRYIFNNFDPCLMQTRGMDVVCLLHANDTDIFDFIQESLS